MPFPTMYLEHSSAKLIRTGYSESQQTWRLGRDCPQAMRLQKEHAAQVGHILARQTDRSSCSAADVAGERKRDIQVKVPCAESKRNSNHEYLHLITQTVSSQAHGQESCLLAGPGHLPERVRRISAGDSVDGRSSPCPCRHAAVPSPRHAAPTLVKGTVSPASRRFSHPRLPESGDLAMPDTIGPLPSRRMSSRRIWS